MSQLQAVCAKAAADPTYRARLKSNPDAVLTEAGVAVPEGKTVEIIETQRHELHLFLGSRSHVPELNALLEKAATDPACQRKLTANPRAAVEEALGQQLPPAMQVRLHEPAPQRVRLVLPTAPDATGELSDLELEAVAGGGVWKNLLDRVCRDTTTKLPGTVMMTTSDGQSTLGNEYVTNMSGHTSEFILPVT